MRAMQLALTASIGALTLAGCAGVSQFTAENFGGPEGRNAAIASQNSSTVMGAQSREQITMGGGVNAASLNSNASMVASYQGIQVADPIDAPPPLGAVGMGQSTEVLPQSRPLMLLPAPGQSAATSPEALSPQETDSMATFQPAAPDMIDDSDSDVFTSPAAASPTAEQSPMQSVRLEKPESSGGIVQGREFIPAAAASFRSRSPVASTMDVVPTPDQSNILQRFAAFDRLLDEGLITRDEYDRRRSENLGALLPYTHAAPAAGLTRPVPSPDAIASRLQALKRTLEMRAITPRQHALERGMILDAVLPAAPRVRAMAEPFPSDILAAASRVGFLEKLRANGVISQSEFEREKAAIDAYLLTGEIPDDAEIEQALSSGAEVSTPSPSPQMSNIAVHLASYRSQQAAQTGWNELQQKFGTQLGGLSSVVREVNLGANRGTFFRLMAVPFQSQTQADALCQQLKRSNQYCDPLSLDG